MEVEDPKESYDELQKYYKHLYPANLLCTWFGYLKNQNASNVLLSRRQFSMTIKVGEEEIYKRFLSFKSGKQFKNALERDVPIKMDIGAIYEQTPKKGGINTPQQKQFILDLDIDSYDNVRTCCTGANICNKCWRLMRVAAKILYRTMNQDFGYKDMLFVFSGRRGMHLWVCDERARNMADSLRRSVMQYLYLVTGNEQSSSQLADNVLLQKNVAFYKLSDRQQIKNLLYSRQIHPFIVKSLKIIEKQFLSLVSQQKLFEKQTIVKVIEKILSRRSDKLLENVQSRWTRCNDSLSKYAVIREELESYQRYTSDYKQKKTIPPLDKQNIIQTASYVEEQIMLTFMYPRLDINVSTAKNHLLKCPFSVHPKTKKISIPFDFESVDTFDPVNCVTLPNLVSEGTKLLQKSPSKYSTPELLSQATKGLQAPIKCLQKFVKNTIKNLKKSQQSLEF